MFATPTRNGARVHGEDAMSCEPRGNKGHIPDMLSPTTSAAQFIDAPTGHWFAGRTFVAWNHSQELGGLAIWDGRRKRTSLKYSRSLTPTIVTGRGVM